MASKILPQATDKEYIKRKAFYNIKLHYEATILNINAFENNVSKFINNDNKTEELKYTCN